MDEPNLPTWAEVETAAMNAAACERFPVPRTAREIGFVAGVLWLKGRIAPRAVWPQPDGTPAKRTGGSQR